MLTISLNTIRVRGPHGLYSEEAVLGNDFEIDVRMELPASISEEWPLLDYSRVNEIVQAVMTGETVPLLEMLVRDVYLRIRKEWPELGKVEVCIRKMHPRMAGAVKYAQVCFEG